MQNKTTHHTDRKRLFADTSEKHFTAIDKPSLLTSELLYQLKIQQTELENQNRELMQAQELLEDARKRYVDLYDFAPITYVTLDRKGYIQNINQAGAKLLGKSRTSLMGSSFASFIKPEDMKAFYDHLSTVFGMQGTATKELRLVDTNNVLNIVQLESMASKDLFVCRTVVIDMTDRIRAEQQRDKQKHQMKVITDALPVMIAYIDNNEIYRFANKEYRNWFQKTGKRLVGETVNAIHGPAQYKKIKNLITKVMNGEKLNFEMQITSTTGEERIFDSTYIPDIDDGTCNGYFVLMRDITESKKLEAERNNLLRESAHMARLTTMGQMVGEIAHELNQPLTAISIYCDACSRQLADADVNRHEIIDTMSRVSEQAKRAADVIVELKRFTSKKELNTSTDNINNVIMDITKLLNIEAHWHNVELNIDLDESIPEVQLDKILIQQVILNLVRNGMEAMDNETIGHRNLHIRTNLEDDKILVSVSDTGSGVASQDIEQIFEAFYSSKQDGMGMGLAICKSVINAHRGKIWALPNEDRGVTVCFTLNIDNGGMN